MISFAYITTAMIILLMNAPASAQDVSLPLLPLLSERVSYALASGVHDAVSLPSPIRKFNATILKPNAVWMRVHFGKHNLGEGSYITITSLEHGAYQRLDAKSLNQWKNSSAFFNGGALELSLYVAPEDEDVFFEVAALTVGLRPEPGELDISKKQECQESGAAAGKTMACNGVDERVDANDPAVGRLVLQRGDGSLTADCTAWIISNGAFLTAGHCIDADNIPLMVEFSVPQSNSNGTINFSSPADQYPIDTNSIEYDPNLPTNDCGNDWGIFGAFANSNTGLRAVEAQGAFYRLTNTTNFSSGHDVRITGYGRDNDPPGPDLNTQFRNSASQTLQTDVGNYLIKSMDSYTTEVDITFGNSGSPLIDLSTGLALGIQTHGLIPDQPDQIPFCTNCSQSFEASDVADAINNFPGSNTRYADVGHPEPLEDGTLFRPYDRIDEAISAVASGGIVSVAPGTYIFATSVNKNITLEAPVGAVTLNHDITVQAGATLTIAPGTELRFASGRGIKVYGTLNADEVTLAASGSSWNGIYFYSGSSGTLTDSDLADVYGAPVIVNNASVTIENSSLENIRNSGGYDMAVWALGTGSVNLYHNRLSTTTGPAVLVQNDISARLHDNDTIMTGPTGGTVYMENYSDADFSKPTNSKGLNVLKGGPGLYAYGNVVINAGQSSGQRDSNYFCQGLGLTVENGGVIYAKYNYWWNGVIPTPTIIGGGAVYASNSRGSSNTTCNSTSAMLAKAGHMSAEGSGLVLTSFQSEADFRGSITEEKVLFEAKMLFAEGRYAEAVALFAALIQEVPSSRAAHAALLELGIVLKRVKSPEALQMIEAVAAQPGVLQATAMGLRARHYVREGDTEAALARFDEIIGSYPASAEAFLARLATFHLYLKEGEYALAAAVLAETWAENTGQARSLALAYKLLELSTDQEVSHPADRAPEEGSGTAQPASLGGVLDVAVYPNPFNPVTTIRYALPEAGQVVLTVYDVLGREVATLVEMRQAAGTHEAIFEASHLPSGTYVYRLEGAGRTRTGTLLLTK